MLFWLVSGGWGGGGGGKIVCQAKSISKGGYMLKDNILSNLCVRKLSNLTCQLQLPLSKEFLITPFTSKTRTGFIVFQWLIGSSARFEHGTTVKQNKVAMGGGWTQDQVQLINH